jgi:hypothetical protein
VHGAALAALAALTLGRVLPFDRAESTFAPALLKFLFTTWRWSGKIKSFDHTRHWGLFDSDMGDSGAELSACGSMAIRGKFLEWV